MKRSKISARSNEKNKILVPTFVINEHPDKTISDVKKLIKDDIMESFNKEMMKSLRNLWRIGDEVETNKKKE